jgi:hypothetical protein
LGASTSSDATDFYDKSISQDKMAAGGYFAAGAMILPMFKFTFDIGKLKKKMSGM